MPASKSTEETTREATPDIALGDCISELHIDTSTLYIFIDKSEYTLQIKSDSIVIKTYPVVFGPNPVDDKRMQGDMCTPEGEFILRNIYPHKSWSKFLWVNYPTEESYKKFNAAKENGEIPKDAAIGGEIGIHGTPDDDSLIDKKENWTHGCISLKNKHIDEIYAFVKVGTRVVIQK